MSSKINKIYFLGRKQGHSIHKFFPTKLEAKRPQEIEAFNSINCLKRTHFINKANILYFRNIPEKTKSHHIDILINRSKTVKKKLIINDINSFYNHDSKNRAFKIWENNNLLCPKHIAFSSNQIKNNLKKVIEKIELFLMKYGKIIIRTNNETGSLGLFVINNKKDITQVLKKLKTRVYSKINFAKDTKIMCVEFINSNTLDNYHNLYRVHILFDNILSYYVTTSKKDQFHSADLSIDDIDRFISINYEFQLILPNIKDKLISAVKLLGNNIGAIEFFLINNEPCFIELNPMWGGHASRVGFGNQKMMDYIYSNKSKLIEKIPNIYKWMNYFEYYQQMYQIINNNYVENFK